MMSDFARYHRAAARNTSNRQNSTIELLWLFCMESPTLLHASKRPFDELSAGGRGLTIFTQ